MIQVRASAVDPRLDGAYARNVVGRAPVQADAEAGQAIYSPLVLGAYDAFVLGFSSCYVWRCRSATMLARYDQLAGPRDLDVGVGTGWFLDHCRWQGHQPEITLLDLNENSLRMAARRIQRYGPQIAHANVLEPVDLGEHDFDSIGLNYLLHCLPGTAELKTAAVVRNLAKRLKPGGVLFGSTILGRGVRHNALGRALMRLYNRKGIFANLEDDRDGLERGLAAQLGSVELEIVGAVALFAARQ
jgi:SAM-dependent methyltransferase